MNHDEIANHLNRTKTIRVMSHVLQQELGMTVGAAHSTAQHLIHRLSDSGYEIVPSGVSE